VPPPPPVLGASVQHAPGTSPRHSQLGHRRNPWTLWRIRLPRGRQGAKQPMRRQTDNRTSRPPNRGVATTCTCRRSLEPDTGNVLSARTRACLEALLLDDGQVVYLSSHDRARVLVLLVRAVDGRLRLATNVFHVALVLLLREQGRGVCRGTRRGTTGSRIHPPSVAGRRLRGLPGYQNRWPDAIATHGIVATRGWSLKNPKS
jgi:hypothetical protein